MCTLGVLDSVFCSLLIISCILTPMDLPLTWNVVLIAAFVLMFAYHFILGQDATVKMIISIYVAILTADGVGNLIKTYVLDVAPGFHELVENQYVFYTVLRLFLFMVCIIVFVVKGGLKIELEKHEHWMFRGTLHAIFAVLSAALFIATILIYLSGNSFIDGMLIAPRIAIYEQSELARVLIDYYQVWFSLPAIAFFITSFFFEKDSRGNEE